MSLCSTWFVCCCWAAVDRRFVDFDFSGFTRRNQPAANTTMTATTVRIDHWRIFVMSAARLRDVTVGEGIRGHVGRARERLDVAKADRGFLRAAERRVGETLLVGQRVQPGCDIVVLERDA